MKSKLKYGFCLYLLLLATCGNSQMQEYDYKRELTGIADQWHKIIFPDDIYEQIDKSFYDIRIIGITRDQDTIEAPYFIKIKNDQTQNHDITFKVINESSNSLGNYYTFEIDNSSYLNQITLNFHQKNYDWLVKLEGSHNQQEWFTIIEKYRILSIDNEFTSYQFNQIKFSQSQYRYYRITIPTSERIKLLSANISLNNITKGEYRNFPIPSWQFTEDRKQKQTIIDAELESYQPVCEISISIADQMDYYRNIELAYLRDSIKTEVGWEYDYGLLTSGILNSRETAKFQFNSTVLRKLKITIFNHDNTPLAIKAIEAKGYVHELIVRFDLPAHYYLVYGRDKPRKAQYDIAQFPEIIPSNPTQLGLGDIQYIKKTPISIDPIFNNKTWLWAIMALVIAILGWFSLHMIRSYPKGNE